MDETMTVALICAAGVAAFLLLHLKSKGRILAPKGWRIMWSRGVSLVKQGAGWSIAVTPGSSLHYVQNFGGRVPATIRLRVEGSFTAPEFGLPATAGLLLQRRGDNGSGVGKFEGYRYFSGLAIPLTEGEHVVQVPPLTVEHWGGVMGGRDPTALRAVLDDLESFGIVFGSAGGRGHGVTGTGRVTLL